MEENFVYLVRTISGKTLSVHRDLESALDEALERNLRHDQGHDPIKVSKFKVL